MEVRSLILKHQAKVFPVLDIALNGVNYFFHIFCSWYLSQINYGTLNALLSILAILLVTGISFQTFTAKEVAKNGVGAKRIYKTAFIYVAIICLLFLSFAGRIAAFTRGSHLALGITLSIFLLNLFLSILRGIFQGEKQFFNLNINFYIEVLSKILFLVVFLPKFNRIEVVLLSVTFGMCTAMLHGIVKLKIKRVIVRGEGSISPVAKQTILIFLSNFFIYYFTSIDMIIINYNLSSISGIYAVILRYSQIILFVSFSLITVFIPNLSSQVEDKRVFKEKAKKYFFILLGVQLLMLIAYETILPLSVAYLFGAEYVKASEYLLRGAFMYIALVDSFYLVNLNIILDRRKYILPLGGTALLFSFFLLQYGRSINYFLYGGIGFYTLLFLTLFTIFYFEGAVRDEERAC